VDKAMPPLDPNAGGKTEASKERGGGLERRKKALKIGFLPPPRPGGGVFRRRRRDLATGIRVDRPPELRGLTGTADLAVASRVVDDCTSPGRSGQPKLHGR